MFESLQMACGTQSSVVDFRGILKRNLYYDVKSKDLLCLFLALMNIIIFLFVDCTFKHLIFSLSLHKTQTKSVLNVAMPQNTLSDCKDYL